MCDNSNLMDRVHQTLKRLGCVNVAAEHLGGGRVLLSGKVRSFDERAILVAAVRTISGVTSVALKLSV